MKKLAVLLFMAVSACAQEATPKEPTIAELKIQIAQKDMQLAALKLQTIQLQWTVQLAQDLKYQQAQDELQRAQAALRILTPEVKK